MEGEQILELLAVLSSILRRELDILNQRRTSKGLLAV